MVYTYTVAGRGDFPLDMLRHDEAYPAATSDAHALRWGDQRSINLKSSTVPTYDRWASFGWFVTVFQGIPVVKSSDVIVIPVKKTGADFTHHNPRCNCTGIVKAGTEVRFVTKDGWSAYVVKNHSDVKHFMHSDDFLHSYVEVPTGVPIID